MIIEIKVPSPGESITEVEIGTWLVEDGAVVSKDQEIAEVESDKATLTIVASEGGKVELKAAEGDSVPVGEVVCTIDTRVEVPPPAKTKSEGTEQKESKEKSIDSKSTGENTEKSKEHDKVKVTSVAKEMMKEHALSVDDVINGLKRLGKKEVEAVVNAANISAPSVIPSSYESSPISIKSVFSFFGCVPIMNS